MDHQTKESKDLKFRQWAESVERKESKAPRKTVEERETVQERETVHKKEIVEKRKIVKEQDDDKWEDRRETVAPPRPPKARKNGSPALIAIIIFLLAIIVFLCLFIVRGNVGKVNTVSEKEAVEIVVDPPSEPAADQAVSAAANTTPEAPPSGITLVVPAEYALYGRTDYQSMTQAEYDQLLSGVRQYIAVQLQAFTKLKDPYYPHFETVTANDDCSVYTVTVNEAGDRSQKELALHEQLSFFTKMYAAYSQQLVTQFEIHYQAPNGTILKSEAFTLDGAAIQTAVPTAAVPTAVPPTAAVPAAVAPTAAAPAVPPPAA